MKILTWIQRTVYLNSFKLLFIKILVHSLQKLKKYHLKQLIIYATKSKVTCLSESFYFHLDILELQQFLWSCVLFYLKLYACAK